MSKTVAGFRPPHCLAPVAGGGGYLGGRPFPVNRQFRPFARKFRNPSLEKRLRPMPGPDRAQTTFENVTGQIRVPIGGAYLPPALGAGKENLWRLTRSYTRQGSERPHEGQPGGEACKVRLPGDLGPARHESAARHSHDEVAEDPGAA